MLDWLLKRRRRRPPGGGPGSDQRGGSGGSGGTGGSGGRDGSGGRSLLLPPPALSTGDHLRRLLDGFSNLTVV